MSKKGVIATLAGLGAMAGGFFYGQERLYRAVLKPNPTKEDGYRQKSGDVIPSMHYVREHPKKQDLYLNAVDRLKLHAVFLPVDDDKQHTYVIAIHGHNDNYERMGIYAKKYYESGYPVLMPDLRGHGRSEGDYVGYGYDDRLDILEWIYYLIRMDAEAKIILHGISMGASTVMLVTGETLPDNVKAAIEDSGYSTLTKEFDAVYRRTGNGVIPSKTATQAVRQVILNKAGYDIRDVDCVAAVARSKTPTLFLHGEADITVPVSMCRELYEAASCPKKMKIFLNAGHVDAVGLEPELYWGTVDRFLSEFL